MFGRFLLAIVILQLARAACQADGSGSDGSCKTCGVTIGQEQYCSECNGANYAPVNGQCADVNAEGQSKTLCPAKGQGKCTQCGGASFMYKDGCYSKDTAPGQSMCTQASEGKCTEAAPGYFLNPLRANTKDSVVSCSDTTGFTDSGKTYRGVQHCERCDGAALTDAAGGDAKCTRCGQDKYLATTGTCGEGCTPDTEFSKEDSDNGKRCFACGDVTTGVASCEKCTPPSPDQAKPACTKCGGNNYLKTAADGTTTCVEQSACSPDSFPVENSQSGNRCVLCGDAANGGVDKCAACTPTDQGRIAPTITCIACTNGYKPSADKTTCEAVSNCKTPGCKACSNEGKENEVCTDCDSSTYLTPTSQCIDSCAKIGNYYGATEGAKKICKECTAANCKTCDGQGQCQACSDGFYKNGDACSPCHESCKTCSAGTASDCTECPTGKALRYGDDGTKGTCGAGCATGTGAGACKTCGLTIDGASYCSECATATEYPQNGVCSSTTVRAAATCKAGSVAKGMCNSCTNGFLRMNGGCYETTKFPGKNVCEEAAPAGDTCQTPADGYKLNNGALITCSAGCKTCTSQDQCDTCKAGYAKTGGNTKKCVPCATGCSECNADDATKCTVCAAGYYLSKEKCIACDKSDGGSITGVANCANCAPPTNNKGPVLCYLIQNTNRSGLSTGAIAGISVAVVAVVGGLVGFLCWWFLCRGKA